MKMKTQALNKKLLKQKLTKALIVVVCSLLAGLNSANASQKQVFTLLSPEGDSLRVSVNENINRDELTKEMISFGIYPTRKKTGCKITKKSNTWAEMKRVETELELAFMINELKRNEKPRVLNANQKKQLSQVPLCEVFESDLVVITKLLKGYDLVSTDEI